MHLERAYCVWSILWLYSAPILQCRLLTLIQVVENNNAHSFQLFLKSLARLICLLFLIHAISTALSTRFPLLVELNQWASS